MLLIAGLFLGLAFALFTIPPLVARGRYALEDWVNRPEPKILTGGLVALTACILLVPMTQQGLILDTEHTHVQHLEAETGHWVI
ncbi:MAG: hypothetical protein AAFX02_11025 [Pseudomonadota bacterium]